jgi:hypothetical protein
MDGSIDEDTAVFTQQGQFRLISDHRIQRGPTFSKPTDVMIKATTGDVIVRYKGKGQDKVEISHINRPLDLNVVASLPYEVGNFKGTVGTEMHVYRSGLLDSVYRVSVNLMCAPAMPVEKFARASSDVLIPQLGIGPISMRVV